MSGSTRTRSAGRLNRKGAPRIMHEREDVRALQDASASRDASARQDNETHEDDRSRRIETAIPRDRYDVIVVGAGIGGLSAAALLAQDGARVLLLEAIHYPGGCASSYEKFGAVFDVGATTFSGVAPTQPLAKLFRRIGTFDGLLPADPPMGISMNGRMLIRHGDRDRWIREAEAFFGVPQRGFWESISAYSDDAYRLMDAVPHLPPRSVMEVLRNLLHVHPRLLRHAPHLFRTVATHLHRHGIRDADVRRFIDAQLLITSQSNSEDVPFLAGALGLSYPDYPVYSVRGGMIRYARFLEQRARAVGADVAFLQPVTGIVHQGGEWTVHTKRDAAVHADAVVTNIPVFNLPAITDGPVRAHFTRIAEGLRARDIPLWGAFTVYGLVDRELARELPINLQVILPEPMRQTAGSTLFLSFAHPDDDQRSPAGTRTLTISTHVRPDREVFLRKDDAYRQWKDAAVREILLALRRAVPELADMDFLRSQGGTPHTFERYTGRADGMVGGIPLHRSVFPFRYPQSVTPFKGLHAIGDTFFPGQGIPGVTLGALAAHQRITSRT